MQDNQIQSTHAQTGRYCLCKAFFVMNNVKFNCEIIAGRQRKTLLHLSSTCNDDHDSMAMGLTPLPLAVSERFPSNSIRFGNRQPLSFYEEETIELCWNSNCWTPYMFVIRIGQYQLPNRQIQVQVLVFFGTVMRIFLILCINNELDNYSLTDISTCSKMIN